MAIVSWKEEADERSGSLDQVRAIRHYTRSFKVITDSTLDGPETILLNSDFLGLLALYVEANGAVDPFAILRAVRVTQPEKDNPFFWRVTYEYSSEPLDPQQHVGATGGQGTPNPFERPPIFTLDAAEFQRVVNVDALGAAVCNSAGAPFSPLPEADDTRLVLTMERNEQEPDWNLILTYQDAVNSDVFLGFAPGTAKVKIKCQSMFESNQYYWKVTYTWSFRNLVNIQGTVYSGWDLHLLDQGFYELDAYNKPRQLLDAQGSPLNEPALLDGQGHQALNGVTAVAVIAGGDGYTNGQSIAFAGGGGSGAFGFILTANSGGSSPIVAAVVSNPGSGYTSPPSVVVEGEGAGAEFAVAIGPRPVFRHYRPYNWLPFDVFNLPTTIS